MGTAIAAAAPNPKSKQGVHAEHRADSATKSKGTATAAAAAEP